VQRDYPRWRALKITRGRTSVPSPLKLAVTSFYYI
jgi:hypothetical protein